MGRLAYDQERVTCIRKCMRCGIEKPVTQSRRDHRDKLWYCKSCKEIKNKEVLHGQSR